jgi:hypothetical protein
VQRALVQLPGADHVSHLELAAQQAAEAVAAGNLAVQQGPAVAGQVLRALGLDAGAPVDLGDRVAIPAAGGGNALYVARASGALTLAPLDPQIPPSRATAETAGRLAALGPVRARAAFGRYLRWAEGGARPDALAADPELAAARAAGLVAIGHAHRVDVERALGAPDRSWGGGAAPSHFLAYRLAEWPRYLYVFEFDTRELLRSQGFVADPAAPPGAPLAPGMTRDAVWARLGPPRAIMGWWPFERWEYPGLGGRPANYEFAHGILLARP